jgi:hypothetical protein
VKKSKHWPTSYLIGQVHLEIDTYLKKREHRGISIIMIMVMYLLGFARLVSTREVGRRS